jgi:hypothetical protein
MTRFGYIIILAASVSAPACTDQLKPDNTPPPGATVGGATNTFDHDNSGISPWDLLNRLEIEGPPRFTSHMHSCPKVRYNTLGNVLTDIGVNAANTANLSAGQLYTSGYNALGGPDYANRIRENIGITTSGASREFDIFAAAAPEIITAFGANSIARCPGAALFDASNQCQASGIECLIGTTPMTEHLEYCNLTVTSASTVTLGKQLAVASILAAAYTCE